MLKIIEEKLSRKIHFDIGFFVVILSVKLLDWIGEGNLSLENLEMLCIVSFLCSKF